MDPTSAPVNPSELYELLGIVGGVIVSGLLGFVVVRRARASRQRMIDAAGEAPAPRVPEKRKGRTLREADPQEEREAEPEGESEAASAEREAAPEPAPAAGKPK